MGKKHQKKDFFKVLLTQEVDSRALKSVTKIGFEPGENAIISILKEMNGSWMALIARGDIKENKNLMFESARPLIESVVKYANRNKPHKPNKRQRMLNRERKAKALSESILNTQTRHESPESSPTTSSSTDSTETAPAKPSPPQPIPDIIPVQPTQTRSYFTHDYIRRQQQQQQRDQQLQQPSQHQLPNQQVQQSSQHQQQPNQQVQRPRQHHQQPIQQVQQPCQHHQQPDQQQQQQSSQQQQWQNQTGRSNTQQHNEYQHHYNHHANDNGYYGYHNQLNNEQYVPYDPTHQLYVQTNQNYPMYPEYTPSTNDLIQTAQPHGGATNNEGETSQQVRLDENFNANNLHPTGSNPNGNGGDNPMQHGSNYQSENRYKNTGGVSNKNGKPSSYYRWMNCLQSTKRMIEEYNDNPKHNKPNTIGKRIKMTDTDQPKPTYEDISDTESSPTFEKVESEMKIEEIPPAQKTEDYPENVLKSAGLPKLN